MRRLTVLGTAALMTSASACTAHEVPTQNDVGFLCSVDGAKLLKPAMSDEVVCEAFKAKLDDVFAQKMIAIDSSSFSSLSQLHLLQDAKQTCPEAFRSERAFHILAFHRVQCEQI